MYTHPCGAAWGGLRVEHCGACHLTFAHTEAGDAHRVGRHGVKTGPRRRRCLTPDEIRAKTIRSGPNAGEPWFAVRVNAYGTEVWSRNQPGHAWFSVVQDSDGQTGAPMGDCLDLTFEALENEAV